MNADHKLLVCVSFVALKCIRQSIVLYLYDLSRGVCQTSLFLLVSSTFCLPSLLPPLAPFSILFS
ncbi:hypothetical protein BD560DRAFT_380847 [Blakeslea trispora]|nr:hypothetical protein BD560DRAFT_380847 [Blakeslea trispora]